MKTIILISSSLLAMCILLQISCGNRLNEGTVCMTIPKREGQLCQVVKNGNVVELYGTSLNDASLKEGFDYKFAANGDTLEKGFYKDNRRIGGYYEYYPSNKLKRYIYFGSFKEDPIYFRTYNNIGAIIAESPAEDLFYGDNYSNIFLDSLNVDSLLDIRTIAITPPNATFVVECFMVNTQNTKDTLHPERSFYVPGQNNGIISTVFKLKQKGNYKVYISSKLFDRDKGVTLQRIKAFEFDFPL